MNHSRSSGKIRVGMIHVDTHGMYYGALMDKHDPMILRGPLREAGACSYSWQSGGVHYYFYTKYNEPSMMTVPGAEGFEITRIWDEHDEAAEDFAKVFGGRPRICASLEEVSDDVDLVFIGDCNGDGADHLKLAIPSIEKGIPTFIDKPFACDVKDARALVTLAEKYKTPIMSLSILGEVPHFTRFRARFAELEEPEFGIIKGGGLGLAGQIHAICLAQHLFGPGAESVECMGKNSLGYIHIDYGGKTGRPASGVVLNCDSGSTYHTAYYASAYSKCGAIHSPGIGDFEFPWGALSILEKIRTMVQTGEPQVAYEEMIENIAVASAARLAQESGKTVYLRDLV